jgi:polyisoprenoid-binding protein YceI
MKILLTLIAAALVAAPAGAMTYTIDPAHTSVGFTIKHLGVSKVHGRFNAVSGTVDYVAGKPASWKTAVEIDPASVDTHIGARDKHLKSPDFFDVEKCPKMSFKSTKAEASKLYGDLTMHCVTKPVVLDLEISEGKDPKGNPILGGTASGTISRKDWAVGSAGPMLGDEVKLELDVEAHPAVKDSGKQ